MTIWHKPFCTSRSSTARSPAKIGKGAWLTKAQILDLYKCEVVCNAVVSEALESADRWRRHLQCDEAVQYFITVSDKQTERLEDVVSRGVSLSGIAGFGEGISLASKLAPSPIAASGSAPSAPSHKPAPAGTSTTPGTAGDLADGDEAQRKAMLQKSQKDRTREAAQAARDEKSRL